MNALPTARMEQALIDRLRLSKAMPKNVTVERTAPLLTMEEFSRLTHQAPYIGVAFFGFTVDKMATVPISGLWQWKLLIVAKASGDIRRRLKGDAFQAGLDHLIDLTTLHLHAQTIDGIGLINVTSSEVIYSEGIGNKALVLAHLNLEIATSLSPEMMEKTID